MNLILKMAWLNSWRNKRRTAVLLCAMVVGLVGVLFTAAFMQGWLDEMVNVAIRSSGGHVKIMRRAYHENPVIEHAMREDAELIESLRSDARIADVRSRLTAGGLLSNARHSAAVRLVGIDPDAEPLRSLLGEAVDLEGRFLDSSEPLGALVGRKLVEKMETGLGRKVVMMGQHGSGDLASGAFRVAGIYDSGNSSADERTVYVLKSQLQDVVGLDGRVTELGVRLRDRDASALVAADVNARLASGGDIMALTWREVMPFVAEVLDMSRRMTVPVLSVFYIAMAFGIANTLLIAIGERSFETGVMLSVGMRPAQVVLLIVVEAVCQAAVAAVLGVLSGSALVGILARTGINLSAFAEGMDYAGVGQVIYPAMSLSHVAWGAAATLAVALAASVLPAVRAARTIPVEAMRRNR